MEYLLNGHRNENWAVQQPGSESVTKRSTLTLFTLILLMNKTTSEWIFWPFSYGHSLLTTLFWSFSSACFVCLLTQVGLFRISRSSEFNWYFLSQQVQTVTTQGILWIQTTQECWIGRNWTIQTEMLRREGRRGRMIRRHLFDWWFFQRDCIGNILLDMIYKMRFWNSNSISFQTELSNKRQQLYHDHYDLFLARYGLNCDHRWSNCPWYWLTMEDWLVTKMLS